jgi:hypothetical protein
MKCNFCSNNNEDISVYQSHNLRNSSGTLMCPILAELQCPECRDLGHTIKYCKFLAFKRLRLKSMQAQLII